MSIKKDNEERFVLRLDTQLMQQLKLVAANDNRSINSQLIHYIQQNVKSNKHNG